MPYGQVLINNALTILGILEQGGTPSNSDAADALVTLNSYWEAAGIDEGWIYAVQQQQCTWTATHASAGIGPTAASPFNVAVPSRIYNATFVLSTGVRVPLNIVPQEHYFGHHDLTAAALVPDELYYDYNIDPALGSGTLYLYPAPSSTGAKLELENAATFADFTLAGLYMLPQGFQDALQEILAWKLLTHYGAAIAQQTAEVVRENGTKAEQRVRAMNARNRMIPPEAAGMAAGGGASPISGPAAAQFQGLQPGR